MFKNMIQIITKCCNLDNFYRKVFYHLTLKAMFIKIIKKLNILIKDASSD